MTKEEIQNFFSNTTEIIYPLEAIKTMKLVSPQSVFPITSQINGHTIAGLVISCDEDICKEYKIGSPPPTPNLKFRMVDLLQTDYVIEILLYFEKRKAIRLHLNPQNRLVRHFLKIGLKHKIIAFHFYNQEEKILIDSITNLDTEEINWFSRNYKLSRKLKVNRKYDTLSKMIENQLMDKKKERRFKFYNVVNQALLIEKSNGYFKAGDVKDFRKESDEK